MSFKEIPGDAQNRQTTSSINPKIEPEDQGEALGDSTIPATSPHEPTVAPSDLQSKAASIRVIPRWLPSQTPPRQDLAPGPRRLSNGRIPLIGASNKGKT